MHNTHNAIKPDKNVFAKERAKAIIFLHHHLHQSLKIEFLMVKHSYIIWSNLYERYGQLKSSILPNACNYCNQFQLQDFKSVYDYNSVLYRINHFTAKTMYKENH